MRLSDQAIRVVDGVVDVSARTAGAGFRRADCYRIVTCSAWGVAELAEGAG